MSEKIKKNQIKTLHAILANAGQLGNKPQLVGMITQGRTIHISELTEEEARLWIEALQKLQSKTDDRQRMVGNIIAMAHEIGWIQKKTVANEQGALVQKNDYSQLHSWVLKYGYLKKGLNDYTYNELPRLVSQFKNVYASELKRNV